MRYFLMIMLLIFVGGCIPDFDNPLTDPNKEKLDSALYGTWFWQEKNESGYIHVGWDKESKLLRAVMVEVGADGSVDVSEYSGHTSSLGNNQYLNLKWVRPENELKGYMVIKYRIEGESLAISLVDSKVIEKAIQEGSLKGTVSADKMAPSVRITEKQKKLQEFFLKNDKELFHEKTHLYKLKLPEKSFPPPADKRAVN